MKNEHDRKPASRLRRLALIATLSLGIPAVASETTHSAPEESPATTAGEDPNATAPETGDATPAEPGTTDPGTHPGHPTTASAGGREKNISESAGVFPNSPLSLIVPPIREGSDWLQEHARLDLGFRMGYYFQQATGGPGERTAAAQDYRVYGTFNVFNYEEEDKGWAGNAYFRMDWRGEIGQIAPNELGSEIGTLATTTYGQNEQDFALAQLYWEQFLFDGKLRARVGKMDPDDYYNLGRFADDYRYFDNLLFSAYPASNHPSGGFGVALQWYLSPEWTVTGGIHDVQGKKTRGIETFFDDGRFFYGLDVTYSPTVENWGKGNYRLGIEYRDSVESKGLPEDTTVYLNIDQEIAEDVAPFLRTSWSTGRGTDVQYTLALGIGVDNPFDRQGDAFGIGSGFVVAKDKVSAENNMEYPTEIFYRWQLTWAMQATLGYQVIFNPVNTTGGDVVGVFEARIVIDF